MQPLDADQSAARTWFEHLRDLICAEFEAIEREAGSAAAFAWKKLGREITGDVVKKKGFRVDPRSATGLEYLP